MADEEQDKPAPPPMARRVERPGEPSAPNPEPRPSASRRRTYDRDRTPPPSQPSGWRVVWIMLAIFGVLASIGLTIAIVVQNDQLKWERDRSKKNLADYFEARNKLIGYERDHKTEPNVAYVPSRVVFKGGAAGNDISKQATKWFDNFIDTVKDRKEFDAYNAAQLGHQAGVLAGNMTVKKRAPGLNAVQVEAVIGYSQAEWRQWDLDKKKLIRIEYESEFEFVRLIARHTWAKSGRTELVCWYLKKFDDKYQLVDWESLDYGNSGTLTVAFEILKAEKLLPRADEYGNLLGLRALAMQDDGLYPYQLSSAIANAGRLAPSGDFAILLQHAEVRRLLAENKPRPALEVLDHLLKLQPNNLGLQMLQAEALVRNQEYLTGLAQATKLAALLDDDVELLTTKWLAYLGMDRVDEAEKSLALALDRNPGHYPALSAYKKAVPEAQLAKFFARFAKVGKPETTIDKLNLDYAKPEEAGFRLALAREFHRLRPKDAQGRRTFSLSLMENKKWDELQELLGKWMKPLNEQERTQLLRDILYASLQAKDPLAVYRVVGPHLSEKSDGFPILARQVAQRADEKPNRYALKKTDDKDMELARKELGQLIEAHAKGYAADPWLDYFLAKLAWLKKDYTGAEKLLAQVKKLPTVYYSEDDEDEGISTHELREFRIRLAVKLGKTLAIYDDMRKQSGNTNLSAIFDELEENKDGTALLDVTARHAREYPNDYESNRYRALGHEFGKNYGEATTAQKQYIDALESGETYGQWKTNAARKKYLRLMVKAGKAEEAHEYAVEKKSDAVDVVYTLAASGQRDDAINRMTDEIRSGEMKAEQFYADPDLKTILMTTRYEKFRAIYPFKDITPEQDE